MAIKFIKNEKIVNTYSLYVYGEITDERWWEEDVTPTMVRDALDNASNVEFIDVYINSPGGSVFAGHAIYNLLKRHPALVRTYVDGIAASAASVVLQAGDERTSANNGMVMIHNPMSWGMGYADDLRKIADTLDQVKVTIEDTYLEKANVSREKLVEMMDAETYMTAQEAVDLGFLDSVTSDSVAISNSNNQLIVNSMSLDPRRHKNVYKNASKIKPFEPTPEPVDYSELELTLAENEITLLESGSLQ